MPGALFFAAGAPGFPDREFADVPPSIRLFAGGLLGMVKHSVTNLPPRSSTYLHLDQDVPAPPPENL